MAGYIQNDRMRIVLLAGRKNRHSIFIIISRCVASQMVMASWVVNFYGTPRDVTRPQRIMYSKNCHKLTHWFAFYLVLVWMQSLSQIPTPIRKRWEITVKSHIWKTLRNPSGSLQIALGHGPYRVVMLD